MTPSIFTAVPIPAYLAAAVESRALKEMLCTEEVLIRLLTGWVNKEEPHQEWIDLPKALFASEMASGPLTDTDIRARPHRDSKLRRCRNCGVRVPKSARIMPWKACSDDCADQLWIKTNTSESEL